MYPPLSLYRYYFHFHGVLRSSLHFISNHARMSMRRLFFFSCLFLSISHDIKQKRSMCVYMYIYIHIYIRVSIVYYRCYYVEDSFRSSRKIVTVTIWPLCISRSSCRGSSMNNTPRLIFRWSFKSREILCVMLTMRKRILRDSFFARSCSPGQNTSLVDKRVLELTGR